MALMAVARCGLDAARRGRSGWWCRSCFPSRGAGARRDGRLRRDRALPVAALLSRAAGAGGVHQPSHRPGLPDCVRAVCRRRRGARRGGETRRRCRAGGAARRSRPSGTALVVVLAVQRRWRAIGVAAGVAVAIALAMTPFIDAAMWRPYPDHVWAFVNRPSGSVTAYQTTLSLFRRLCVADPVWNPSPAASCAPIAFIIPTTAHRRRHGADRDCRGESATSGTLARRRRRAVGAHPARLRPRCTSC